jgi:hypothetical protein
MANVPVDWVRSLLDSPSPALTIPRVDGNAVAIATRYLGDDRGRQFSDQRGDRGVVHLPMAAPRAWHPRSGLPD